MTSPFYHLPIICCRVAVAAAGNWLCSWGMRWWCGVGRARCWRRLGFGEVWKMWFANAMFFGEMFVNIYVFLVLSWKDRHPFRNFNKLQANEPEPFSYPKNDLTSSKPSQAKPIGLSSCSQDLPPKHRRLLRLALSSQLARSLSDEEALAQTDFERSGLLKLLAAESWLKEKLQAHCVDGNLEGKQHVERN